MRQSLSLKEVRKQAVDNLGDSVLDKRRQDHVDGFKK